MKTYDAIKVSALILAAALLLGAGCTNSNVQLAGHYPKPVADFQYQMLLAIEKEKVYPWEASGSHIEGKVIVSFNYLGDGVARSIHVDDSSGNRYLDEAALKAVANAKLPPKPPELSAAEHFMVAIVFTVHH